MKFFLGDELLELFPKTDGNLSDYRIVHAIGPFIVDKWNSKFNDSVFMCYYRSCGELQPPKSFDELKKEWHRFFTPFIKSLVSLEFDDLNLGECCICFGNVRIRDSRNGKSVRPPFSRRAGEPVMCSNCVGFIHSDCLENWKTECPICGSTDLLK